MRQNTRTQDLSARYGREEFAVIFPEISLENSLPVAEKVSKAIEGMDIRHASASSKVTISLGLASFPHHAGDKEALIRSADAALYVSKRAGKNRLTVGAETGDEKRTGALPGRSGV